MKSGILLTGCLENTGLDRALDRLAGAFTILSSEPWLQIKSYHIKQTLNAWVARPSRFSFLTSK
jgi:hypothetical protein